MAGTRGEALPSLMLFRPIAAAASFLVCMGGLEAAQSARLRLPIAQTSPAASAAAEASAGAIRAPEQRFILEGLDLSRGEAEIARLAVSQATRSDVRDFAQQLLASYRDMNTALEALARRKGVEAPLQPTSFSERHRSLAEQAGDGFDRSFIRQIAQATQRGLRLCEDALANAKDGDVRALAGNLLPIARDHVNRSTELEKSL